MAEGGGGWSGVRPHGTAPEAIRVLLGAYGLPERGLRALLYKHAMFSANS